MSNKERIAIVGAGTMAEAIIAGLLRAKVATPQNIVASGPRPERGRELEERFGISTTTSNTEAVTGASVICLCAKPQTMPVVLSELKGAITEDALVISIAAGIRVQSIKDGIGYEKVVRAMPNTPGKIGQGITVWCPDHSIGEEDLDKVARIVSSLGMEVRVNDEEHVDRATALSGTGPAYVFLFMEALVDAGVHIGLPRRLAETIATQTVLGSAHYAAVADTSGTRVHLATLRNEVTSPAGTTTRALFELERGRFRNVVCNAVVAAYDRARELAEKLR